MREKNVAILLCGCGRADGSEVHETAALAVTLNRNMATITFFAPDKQQHHVVNHYTGQVDEDCPPRSMLVEGARIARGKIEPLSSLECSAFDALFIPGGAGVGKNLCDFAFNKEDFTVDEEIATLMKNFNRLRKPIGLVCIAPMMAAKVFGHLKCQLTIGHDTMQSGRWPLAATVKTLENLGAVHVNTEVTEALVDKKNRLISTPAFMCGTAEYHEVFDGIADLVVKTLALVPGG